MRTPKNQAFYASRPKFDTCQALIQKDVVESGHAHVELPMQLLTSFCQGAEGTVPFGFYETGTAGSNPYMGFSGDLKTMFDAWQKWTFPQHLLDEAKGLSRELMYVLQSESNPRTVRRQDNGRFDCGSMVRVITDIHAGRFNPITTRPFKKRVKNAPKRPGVFVAVQGNPEFMWAKSDNIPNAVRAGLAVTWACQALDCPANMSVCYTEYNKGKAHFMHNVIEEGREVNLHGLGIAFHRDLWRWAWGCALAHHPDIFAVESYCKGSGSISAKAPTKCLDYIRKQYAPEVLVVIGDFKDVRPGDIHIKEGIENPKGVVMEAAKQLAKGLAQGAGNGTDNGGAYANAA